MIDKRSVSPRWGLGYGAVLYPGLTPWAKFCCPVGALGCRATPRVAVFGGSCIVIDGHARRVPTIRNDFVLGYDITLIRKQHFAPNGAPVLSYIFTLPRAYARGYRHFAPLGLLGKNFIYLY